MRGKTKVTLTSGSALRIYTQYAEGAEPKALAEAFGTSIATVTRIIRGQIWAEVTGGRNISRYDAMVAFRKAYIQARFDQGCRSQAVLAGELGISRQGINRFIKIHNLGKAAA